MELFLAHIPHIALILALILLFVRMEAGERRMRAATTAGDVEQAEATALTVRGAFRILLLLLLIAAVGVLITQAMRGVLPSAYVVIDYLVAGGVLAVWFAWSVPQALAPGARTRMGGFGRGAVRVLVGIVAVGAVIIAGMALAHGVVLPAL